MDANAPWRFMNTAKKGPVAPVTAVDHIIKAFNGVEEKGGTDGWLVTFPNEVTAVRATDLIGMLNGWKANPHPNILHMIRILGV